MTYPVLDEQTISDGIASIDLMEKAGQQATEQLPPLFQHQEQELPSLLIP